MASLKGNVGLKTRQMHLQEMFLEVLNQSSNAATANVAQIWSTALKKVDFPECKNLYVPHNFFVGEQGNTRFKHFVKLIRSGVHPVILLHSPPGMGKSRATEQMHSELVCTSDYLLLYIKMGQCSFWFDCEIQKIVPSVDLFLQNCVPSSRLSELQQQIFNDKVRKDAIY